MATRCAVAPILTGTQPQQQPGMAIRAAHARKAGALGAARIPMLERPAALPEVTASTRSSRLRLVRFQHFR